MSKLWTLTIFREEDCKFNSSDMITFGFVVAILNYFY